MKVAEVVVEHQVVEQKNYEEYVQEAMNLRELQDKVQWKWGDLAIEFTRDCGKKMMKQFAREAGIAYTTLTRCRDVSRAYTPAEREQYPMLSWTHFREAAAKHDRDAWLARAHDENWSVEKMKKMMRSDQEEIIDDGKQVPPRPDLEFCTGCRKWYILDSNEQCNSRGNCYDD